MKNIKFTQPIYKAPNLTFNASNIALRDHTYMESNHQNPE